MMFPYSSKDHIRTIYDELFDSITKCTDTSLYKPVADFPLKLYENMSGKDNTNLTMVVGKIINSVIVFDGNRTIKTLKEVEVYSTIKSLIREGLTIKYEPYHLLILPYDLFDTDDLKLQFKFLVKFARILFDQILNNHNFNIYEFKKYNLKTYKLAPIVIILKLYARINEGNIKGAYKHLKEKGLVDGIKSEVMYMNFKELFEDGEVYKHINELEIKYDE